MKVVVVSPFRSPIRIRIGVEPQTNRDYRDWMGRLGRKLWSRDASGLGIMHGPRQKASGLQPRYSDLSMDANPYPEEWCVIELAKPERSPSREEAGAGWPQLRLQRDRVRLYPSGVGLYEAEFELAGAMPEGLGAKEAARSLSHQLRDGWCPERLAWFEERVLQPLLAALREENSTAQFLEGSGPSLGQADDDSELSLYWVSAGLVCEAKDQGAEGQLREAAWALIEEWLHYVAPAEEEIKKVEKPEGYSLRWVNYAFRERSPLAGIGEKTGQSVTWEALCYAQYVYSAMERLSRRTSRLLHKVYGQKLSRRIRPALDELEQMLRASQLFRLAYNERRRYLSREMNARLEEILSAWDFKALSDELEQHLEQARENLERAHEQVVERGVVFTDILLAALAVLSLIDFAVNMTLLSRELQANAMLGTQSDDYLGVVGVVATTSFDSVILASLGLAIFFIAIYCLLRRRWIV